MRVGAGTGGVARVRRGWRVRWRAGERGSVTAETAVVLPALLLVLAVVLWVAAAALAQVRCVDAARAGARALARGEQQGTARSMAAQAAPAQAQVSLGRRGDLVRVEVSARVRPLGGVLSGLPALAVRAEAIAAAEPEPAAAVVR